MDNRLKLAALEVIKNNNPLPNPTTYSNIQDIDPALLERILNMIKNQGVSPEFKNGAPGINLKLPFTL